jgi:DNA-binding NarL/FixJ family response regulator
VSTDSPAVLLVEDHAALGQMMSRFLREQGRMGVWAIARTAEEALARLAAAGNAASAGHSPAPSADGAAATLPDLVLVDVSLPGMSGIELIGELARLYPGLRCLVLSAHRDPSYVRQALDKGARGYVAKGAPDALLEAIDHVLQGGIYLSAEHHRALRSQQPPGAPSAPAPAP